MPDDKQIPAEIVKELERIIRELGGSHGPVNLKERGRAYYLLQSLGADKYLLATVGSWRDTMSDEDVLKGLISWHRHAGTA